MTIVDIGAVAATFSTISASGGFILRAVIKSVVSKEIGELYKWLGPKFEATEKRYTDHVEKFHGTPRR